MGTVIKVLELVGESQTDWTEAVRGAVAEASKTVDHITGVEVSGWTADVRDGKLYDYKATCRIAFAVDPNRHK